MTKSKPFLLTGLVSGLFYTTAASAHAGHDHGGNWLNGLFHSLQGWDTVMLYALLAVLCVYSIYRVRGN